MRTKRKKPETLSPEMVKALEIIMRGGGEIVRYPGGFWAKEGAKMKHSGGRQPFNYPEEYVGAGTVKALLKRGYIVESETRTGQYGAFTTKYKLVIQQP
jgi:hypothetical protein